MHSIGTLEMLCGSFGGGRDCEKSVLSSRVGAAIYGGSYELRSAGELVLGVADPEVFIEAEIDQAVVATPVVGMEDSAPTLPRMTAWRAALEAFGTISV